jgi:hypothetical protein
MASGMYQSAKEGLFDRAVVSIDSDTDTLGVALVAADQAGNLNTHDFRDDITEVTGTNYTSGGVALASPTVTASAGVVTFDAADTTFTNVTIAAIRGSVIYKNVGSAATDPVAFWHDFGAQSVTAANFVVQWNASGIATLT